ncbi:MAG: hypothetical protein J0M07_18415 [Anaerolineae bacterium]|nr:hypothetical protein [Anaerolineae bacterium]
METLIAAIFVIFLMVFAGFNLAQTTMSAQQTMQAAVVEMYDRHDVQDGTQLTTVDAHTTDFGATILVTLANTGMQAVSDFDKWDVIVHYGDDLAGYHINWLGTGNVNNEWSPGPLQLHIESVTPASEIYNRGILDPGEQVTLTIRVSPPVEAGTGIVVRVATPNGSSTTSMLAANNPPEVVVHSGITLETGQTVTISSTELRTTDLDGDDLVYSIINSPTLGTLSYAVTFTQADIDAGLITYTSGSTAGLDSFNFTVTDGKDTIALPFGINILEPTPSP